MARRKRAISVRGIKTTSERIERLAPHPRYIPPRGDHCPVEKLPPEVLAYIFELGTRAEEHAEDWEVEEDDGDEEYEDVDESDAESMDIPESFTVEIADESDGTTNADTEKIRGLQFPVRMSHVCRRWRQIAINTTVLWTSLDFLEPHPFNKSREWISRSKQSPLEIEVDLDIPDEDLITVSDRSVANAAATDLACILDLIIPHVARWRTFDLSTSLYEHMFSALTRLEMCPADPGAPLLRTLSLRCTEVSDDDDPDVEHFTFQAYSRHTLPFGGQVPQLSHVQLWGVHLDWGLFIPSLERSAASLNAPPSVTTKLTELELMHHTRDVRPSYEDFVNIIRCAPKLRALILGGSGPAPRRRGQPLQPLFLPNLKHLELGFLEEDQVISLLRLFYTPGLTSISLDFEDGSYTDFMRELVKNMLVPDPLPEALRTPPGYHTNPAKYTPRLIDVTDVRLSGMPCAEECAYFFYSACPKLKHLYLNMNFVPRNFFDILIQEDKAPRRSGTGLAMRAQAPASHRGRHKERKEVMCDQLEALTISGVEGWELVKLVKKRKDLGVPIQELNIDQSDGISDSDIKWLNKNVRTLELVEFSDDEEVSILDSDEE